MSFLILMFRVTYSRTGSDSRKIYQYLQAFTKESIMIGVFQHHQLKHTEIVSNKSIDHIVKKSRRVCLTCGHKVKLYKKYYMSDQGHWLCLYQKFPFCTNTLCREFIAPPEGVFYIRFHGTFKYVEDSLDIFK